MDNGFISATYTVSVSLYSAAIRTEYGYPVIKEGENYSTQNYQMKGNSRNTGELGLKRTRPLGELVLYENSAIRRTLPSGDLGPIRTRAIGELGPSTNKMCYVSS